MSWTRPPAICASTDLSSSPASVPPCTVSSPKHTAEPKPAERCQARTGLTGLEGDGDPLDICVLTEKAISHGKLLVSARPIGGRRMIDGIQADDKVIAILEADINYGHMRDVADCPPGVLDRLKHYFLSYKQGPAEQAPKVTIAEVYDRAEALEVIQCSLADYRERFGAPEEPVAELRRLITGKNAG